MNFGEYRPRLNSSRPTFCVRLALGQLQTTSYGSFNTDQSQIMFKRSMSTVNLKTLNLGLIPADGIGLEVIAVSYSVLNNECPILIIYRRLDMCCPRYHHRTA